MVCAAGDSVIVIMQMKLLLFLATACLALGQGTPNLSFTYQGPTDASPATIGAGGTIPLPATLVGSRAQLLLSVTNRGNAPVDFTGSSSSSAQFTTVSQSIVLAAGQSGQFTITFSPSSTGTFSGVIALFVRGGTTIQFTLTGNGSSPELITSYSILPGGNQTAVSDGGTILFPVTQVGQTVTARFLISNRGTGPGRVESIALDGRAFRLTGLPLLPATVNPATTLEFSIVFSSTVIENSRGSLRVRIDGSVRTISLAGSSEGALFQYELVRGSSVTTLSPDATIVFEPAMLDTSTSVSIRVQNIGNANGTVSTVSVLGSGFQVSNLIPLPSTLSPSGILTFTLNSVPTEPGPSTARLLVNGVAFNLSGTGLGALLSYSFAVGSSASPLVSGGTASFPNTAVGSVSEAFLTIRNTGTLTANINSISLTGQVFGATIPTLPLQIPVDTAVQIRMTFGPNALGALTGTLGVDEDSFNLRGIGAAPPTLPSYSFSGVGDSAPSSNQPLVSLSLASPYPAIITGTLTLSFTSDSFSNDPAIQFAEGGRVVSFRIPAGSTQAIFGNGTMAQQLQTGSVAGLITITPAFRTSDVSITPTAPPVKTVTIAAGPPVLRNVQIGAQTATSFEIIVGGYATTRSLTQLTLQFTAGSGANLQTTTLNINADSAFSSWYQSTASAAAGSQFTATIVIAVNGSTSAVQSVAVTATNSRGTSNSLSGTLR